MLVGLISREQRERERETAVTVRSTAKIEGCAFEHVWRERRNGISLHWDHGDFTAWIFAEPVLYRGLWFWAASGMMGSLLLRVLDRSRYTQVTARLLAFNEHLALIYNPPDCSLL